MLATTSKHRRKTNLFNKRQVIARVGHHRHQLHHRTTPFTHNNGIPIKTSPPSLSIIRHHHHAHLPPKIINLSPSLYSSSFTTNNYTILMNHSCLFSTTIINNTKNKQMLAQKKIIITGASSGIGMAAVKMAIQEGAVVAAIGRNINNLKTLQEETTCHIVLGDLTIPEDCKRVVDEAATLMGGVTTLVNCAGVLQGGAIGSPAANLDNLMFNFKNNTQSVWSMMEYTIPYLKENAEGSSIVNISSVNGLQSFAGVGAYCATKAAVDMLTKCAAVDLAPFNITVNSICPGVVETNLQKTGGLNAEQYAAFLERSKTVTHPLAIPRNALAQPVDVANLICFLVSDKAKWITGDNIKIDAGRSAMGAR